MGLLYLLCREGCLTIRLTKPESNNVDEETGNIEEKNDTGEAGPTDGPCADVQDAGKVCNMVASILHDYATEARQIGSLKASLQPIPGSHRQSGIYPNLPEVHVHASTHTTQMLNRDM